MSKDTPTILEMIALIEGMPDKGTPEYDEVVQQYEQSKGES